MNTSLTAAAIESRISIFLSPREAEHLRLSLEARSAIGEWLGKQFAWDHFVTLTFEHRVSEGTARREFDRWVLSLEQRARRSLGWFYALERGAGGQLHIHALLAGTRNLLSVEVERAWARGRAAASRYDPSKAGTYYVTKGVGFSIVDYDIASPESLKPFLL
jgi:hypothetical protein